MFVSYHAHRCSRLVAKIRKMLLNAEISLSDAADTAKLGLPKEGVSALAKQ